MGMDGVEIVMRVEDAFEVCIKDSEARELLTPAELIDLVMSKVGRTTHASCLTQRAFHRLRASLMRHGYIPRRLIRPDTQLSLLFPRSSRKRRSRK
jgi:hypothetical protein